MLVFVTQEHIEQAKRCKVSGQVPMALNCPLALALEDMFPGKSAWVSSSEATIIDYLEEGRGVTKYRVSSEAFLFIHHFDHDYHVEPGAYELRQAPIHVPLNEWLETI